MDGPCLSEALSSVDRSDRKSAVMPAGSARGLHRYRCIDDNQESDNKDDDLGRKRRRRARGGKLGGKSATKRSAINLTKDKYNATKEEESKETSVR